jgi:hypothetical protein
MFHIAFDAHSAISAFAESLEVGFGLVGISHGKLTARRVRLFRRFPDSWPLLAARRKAHGRQFGADTTIFRPNAGCH